MQTSYRREIPQLVVILAMLAVAVAVWPLAPERLPVHWNLAGEVDRYGGRFEALFVMPIVAAGIYLLLLFLPRIDPGRANYESFAKTYALIRTAILAMLAFFYACMLLAGFGFRVDMQLLTPAAVGIVFCVLGNVAGKIRPNWFVGVRTPWTLSSRESWNKTHRLAGRLFIILGLMLIAVGFIPGPTSLVVVIGVGILMLVWLVVYSYMIWRTDPDRIRPAGTSPSSE